MTTIQDLSVPLSEPDRLRVLDALGLPRLRDTELPDRLARLAANLVGCPAAVVNLVGGDRQYLVGQWSEEGEGSLDRALDLVRTASQAVAGTGREQVIRDFAGHPLLDVNPALHELGVRSYAGIPIRSREGLVLGALGAIDFEPREWREEQKAVLRLMAEFAGTQIEALRSARELERSESHYRRLTESSPHAIYALDREGRFTEVNPACEELLGRAVEELRGRHFTEVTAAEGAAMGESVFARMLEGGHDNVTVELPLTRPGGEVRLARITAVTIREDGRMAGVHGIAEDVTEERRVEGENARLMEILKEKERALRDSEERYRGLVEQSLAGFYLLNRDRFEYVNPRVAEIFGYEMEELLDRCTLRDLVHAEDWERVSRRVEERLDGRRSGAQYLFRGIRKDGDRVWVEVHGTARRIGDRVVVAGVMLDVTQRVAKEAELERKRAELAESRRFLRGVLDSLPNQVAVIDADGEILAVNRAWERFAAENGGDPASTGVGANYLHSCDVADGPDAELARAAARGIRGVIGGEAEDYALEYPCHGPGVERWFVLRASRFAGDGAVRVVLSHEDVTARVRSEAAVQASERRFRSLFEHNPQPVFLIGTDGTFLDVNPACERATGYARSEMQGLRGQDVVPEEQVADVLPVFRRATEGEPQSYEHDIITRDGRRREVRVTTVPVIVDDQVVALFGIAEDIGERKRLEDQLRQATKMEAVGRLAGGVAHDFNNLLTVINGHAEMVLDDLLEADPLRADLEEIRRTGERAGALTRQLLVFSRRQVVRPRPIALNTVISDIQRMLKRVVGEDVRLQATLADELWPAMIDPGQVEQLLLNLVINARDAMHRGGGRIGIATRNLVVNGNAKLFPLPVLPGQYAVLEVEDTGAGMDEETLSQIFDPFFTTKEVGKGTGLGLATVYGIVKQADGYVWAESEPGQGTRFTILLPRTMEPVDEVRPAAAAGNGRGAGGTILLVEDEDAVRSLARRVLERRGHTVLEAAGAEEALRLAEGESRPIDLLLTDVVMPGLNGPALARRIGELRPGIRTAYMTGYVHEAIREEGVLDSGAALVEKPFTPATLVRVVEGLLAEG